MRLLIAGWHGQVARALIEAAPALPYVKALAAGRPALDVRDPRSVERAFADLSPDIVINTAAYTAVDQAESDQEAAFALNRDGAALLARAAARRDVPIIHLSTHYVFDGTKPAPYVEADTPAPATIYGHSKLAGERAVSEATPRHVIIRTGWVFSAGRRNFVTKVMESAAHGAPLRVVNDQHGNPTYAPHLASAILEVAHQLATRTCETPVWGTYHAPASGTASWYGLAGEILEQAARRGIAGTSLEPIATADYPAPAARPLNAALDGAKFARTFALRLPSWQEGVAACVEELTRA